MYDFAPILSRLKAVKKNANMTNEELAQKSGVPVGTINKIFSGDTKEPKLPALMSIASALGTSVDYLVYGKHPVDTLSLAQRKDEAQLLEDYRSLNPQGQAAALAAVHGLTDNPIFKKGNSSASGTMDA